MTGISPQTDAGDPLFTCIDEDALTDPQVPDVLGKGLATEGHAEAVVGQEITGPGDRVERRDGSLHVLNVTVRSTS
jgi:hypothetical protein